MNKQSIKAGDYVRFLNEKQDGVVIDINNNLALVRIEGDFTIPVPINELVIVEQQSKPIEEEAKPKKTIDKNPIGIFLAFERLTDSLLNICLHNNMSDNMQMAWYEQKNNWVVLKKTAEILRGQTYQLYRVNLEQFNDWPNFILQYNLINYESADMPSSNVVTIKMNAKTFHAAFKHCFFLNKQAYLFQLDNIPVATDWQKLKQHTFEPKTSNEINVPKPAKITDLHIEKLAPENATFLTDYQIVQLQMDIVKRTIDTAIVHGMPEIILIHGVGKHLLKNRIRQYIDSLDINGISYEDADHIKYGGGATLIKFTS